MMPVPSRSSDSVTVAPLSVVYGICVWTSYLAVVGYCETQPHIFTVSGSQALLNCTAPNSQSHVTWLRPGDGQQLAHDGTVSSSGGNRYRVMGDHSRGQYNLFIRAAQFPLDNGTWICSIFNSPRVRVDLTVLVPPADPEPQITPISGILFHVDSEAYTYTCSAHFSYPPVSLGWVKETGPLMEYDPLPTALSTAPDHTMAASTSLVLTPRNHGSVFVCQATHPTFRGKVYRKELQFIVADTQYGLQGLEMPLTPSVSKLGPGTLGLVVVSAILIFMVFVVTVLLWKCRSRWRLNVPKRCIYQPIRTTDNRTSPPLVNGSVHTVINNDPRTSSVRQRRRHLLQVFLGTMLLCVTLVSLAFMIPVYLTGFSMPIEGVDEIVTVLAGSLLWLDCSSLATQTDDLLVVGWRKEYLKFYNQYNNPVLGGNFGFPFNATPEVALRGQRTRSHGMGQISIWPSLPQDQGLYICEVARIRDDLGRTAVHRKLFAVGVLSTPPLNTALLGLVGVALVTSLSLATLLAYHTIRFTRKREGSGSKKYAEPDTKKELSKETSLNT